LRDRSSEKFVGSFVQGSGDGIHKSLPVKVEGQHFTGVN
jgi:hypothetical protein